jgi:hypothetical protein
MAPHRLFGALSPALASEILEFTFANDKPLYRATLEAVAQSRKLRPVFLERQPRAERHAAVISALGRPALGLAGDTLIRNWLVKQQSALLTDFLDALNIPHEKGVLQDVPPSVEEAALQSAIEGLLARHPREIVALYLHAFQQMNEGGWANLDAHLQTDPRLKLG